MFNKKPIIFFLILLLLAATGYGFWKFKKGSAPGSAQIQAEIQPISAGVEFLSSEAVVSPVLAYDNLSIWYFSKNTGELLRQHLKNKDDLKRYPLAEGKIVNFALWPTSGSDFIVGSPDGLFLYKASAEKFMAYPPEVKFIDWVIGGQKVAYVWTDKTGSFLSVAEADNSRHEAVVKLPQAGFRVSVSPNGKSFVLYSAAEPRPVYFVSQGIGVLEPLIDKFQVLRGKFSADGQAFAYVGGDLSLNILDVASKKSVKLGILSAPEAFAWSGKNLYWASKNSEIFKSAADGQTVANISELAPQSQGLSVTQLLPGASESELFFVAEGSGRLGVIRF